MKKEKGKTGRTRYIVQLVLFFLGVLCVSLGLTWFIYWAAKHSPKPLTIKFDWLKELGSARNETESELLAQLKEYHGLESGQCKIVVGEPGLLETADDTPYYLQVNGTQYNLGRYKNQITEKIYWTTDYYSDAFESAAGRYIRQVIDEIDPEIRNASTGGSANLLPIWMNKEETEALLAGKIERSKWRMAVARTGNFIGTVTIRVDKDLTLSEEQLAILTDKLFFVDAIIIYCPKETIRYEPFSAKIYTTPKSK